MDGEDDRRPRRERDHDGDRARPGGSPNRTVWLVLGAAGCGLVLVCSGSIAALVFWGVRSSTDIPVAQSAADQFLDRLQRGKIDDAYAGTSTRFRAEQSREQFGAFVQRFETLTRHTSRVQNGFRLFQGIGGKRVFLQMTLSAPNNAMTCTLTPVEEAGGWKVEKITVP